MKIQCVYIFSGYYVYTTNPDSRRLNSLKGGSFRTISVVHCAESRSDAKMCIAASAIGDYATLTNCCEPSLKGKIRGESEVDCNVAEVDNLWSVVPVGTMQGRFPHYVSRFD